MKAYILYFSFVMLLGCRGVDEGVYRASRYGAGEALPNSYILDMCASKSDGIFSSFATEALSHEGLFRSFRQDFRVRNFEYLTAFPALNGKQCSRSILSRVDFMEGEDAHSILKSWQREGVVRDWEPNWLNKPALKQGATLSFAYLEDGQRWWTEAIALPSAMQTIHRMELSAETLFASPVIAVLDSGVDYQHPSLVGRVWRNEGASSLCQDDEWGCNTVDVPDGWLGSGVVYPFGTQGPGESCDTLSTRRRGDCAHATHIAGILAGDVASGMPGVCPFCKIMNIRVFESVAGEGRVPDSAILRGLKYLSSFERSPGKNLVRVVNLSFGKYQKGRAVSLYIEALAKHRDGILVFAAAGNEDSQRRVYPAAHFPVIAVTALAASGRKATYANYGPWVSLAAPGGEFREGFEFAIESSVPGSSFALSQGTSMATPVAAGIAGLLLAVQPDLSFDELRERLLSSASPQLYASNFGGAYNSRNYHPKIDGNHVPLLGTGLVDASAALRGIRRQDPPNGNKERVRIDCAEVVNDMNTKGPTPNAWSFFLLVPLFCLALWWIEKRCKSNIVSNS